MTHCVSYVSSLSVAHLGSYEPLRLLRAPWTQPYSHSSHLGKREKKEKRLHALTVLPVRLLLAVLR